jgi:flagellar secretion chaperone FliS
LQSNDPYSAYIEGNVYSGNPVRLVIALYEGAIEAILAASDCLRSGDIAGRSQKINKAINILMELIASLDHEKGGEVSANLAALYSYLQKRLIEAHARQEAEPLQEAVALLSNLLEGWQGAAETMDRQQGELSMEEATRQEKASGQGAGWNYGFELEDEVTAPSVCAVL